MVKNLDNDDILLLIGARQVGKTTVLRSIYRLIEKRDQNVYMFSLEDPMLLADLNAHPENIFNYIPKQNNRIFLILDEIQYLDNPTNFLKYIYDLYAGKIKCVVSGSSAFYVDRKFKDSLAGRKRIIKLFSFSFSEFLLTKNENDISEKIVQHNYFKNKKKLKLLK